MKTKLKTQQILLKMLDCKLTVFSLLLLTHPASSQSTQSFNGGNQVPIGGPQNSAFGVGALSSLTNGSRNSAFGWSAFAFNTSGIKITAIGAGANAGINLLNATAIGADAIVTTSNAVQLGDAAVTRVFAGVGTTGTVIAGGLQITGGSISTGNVLTSDALGNATWQNLSSSGIAWSLNGNSGNIAGTHFLGTLDFAPLDFRVNNNRVARMDINNNFLFGINSGANLSTGYSNVSIGDHCLYNSTIGYGNIAVGSDCMYSSTSAYHNVALGSGAMASGNGSENVVIGKWAYSSSSIGDYNIGIGSNISMASPSQTNCGAIGSGAVCPGSDVIRIGDVNLIRVESQNGLFTTSDGRFKENVEEHDVKGIEFIKLLRPVSYYFNTKKLQEFQTRNLPDSIRNELLKKDFSISSRVRHTGFIAQEVEMAAKECNFNFDGVQLPINSNDKYTISYAQFVVPLVKAVQEQQKMIEELQEELRSVKSRNGATGITNKMGAEFGLQQNEPNPFTHETLIRYNLPASTSNASMNVYDLSGKQIKSFKIEDFSSTALTITSEDLAPGIYIYSIIANGKVLDSKKMIVAEK